MMHQLIRIVTRAINSNQRAKGGGQGPSGGYETRQRAKQQRQAIQGMRIGARLLRMLGR